MNFIKEIISWSIAIAIGMWLVSCNDLDGGIMPPNFNNGGADTTGVTAVNGTNTLDQLENKNISNIQVINDSDLDRS